MSKSIWHTADETPGQESRVVWKSGNVICGGRFDTYYKCFYGPASQFVDLRTVSRWAYIDDLLALENELERTRKALGVAKDKLDTVRQYHRGTAVVRPDDMAAYCDRAIEQITALEQKDVK